MNTESQKLGNFDNPEALASALEKDQKNKNLANRVREISKKAIELNSKDLRTALRDELTGDEKIQIIESLPDSGIDQVLNKPIEPKVKTGELGALGIGGIMGAEEIKSVEEVLSFGEKALKWFEDFFDGIKMWMWNKFPKLAEMFGLDNPKAKIEEEKKKKIQETKEKAEELQEKAEKIAKPKYDNFARIYFKIFRASSELENVPGLEIDKKTEQEVARCTIDSDYFRNLKYNDLKNPKNADVIFEQIKTNLRGIPEEDVSDSQKMKKYIKLVLMSISGGYEKEPRKWWKFNANKKHEVKRGNNFIKAHYKNIENENPNMSELFSKVDALGDFDIFERGDGNMEDILNRMKGKVETLYQGSANRITNLSQADFDGIKGGLDSKLQNLGEFKIISLAILNSNNSRHLGNGFSLSSSTDTISELDDKSKELVDGFIGDENSGLKKYANDMYASFFESGNLIGTSKNIPKKDITLRQAYSIYSITGGKTSIEDLNPMQKLNLTAKMLLSFGEAEDIGGGLGKTSKKLINGEAKIDPSVKELLESIGKAGMTMIKDAAEFSAKFGYGFAKENLPLAIGIAIITLKAPIFVNRHSIL